MKTRKEWTEAKEKAELAMPKKGKPDIGPNLEKFHRLKGKDPETILRNLEKGLDLYEGVPANDKNTKAKALLKSMRLDVGLARDEHDTVSKAKLLEASRKEYAKLVEKEVKAFKAVTPEKVQSTPGLKRLFMEYATNVEHSAELVDAAFGWAAKSYESVALKYGADDTWNQGEAGRALYAHYSGAKVIASSSALRSEIGAVELGFAQMVWSDASQSMFGRWKKSQKVIDHIVGLKLAKVRAQLGLED
jgi:hypothetical protein